MQQIMDMPDVGAIRADRLPMEELVAEPAGEWAPIEEFDHIEPF